MTEVIHRRAFWKTLEDAGGTGTGHTGWVAWFNHHRLLEPIGYLPPTEAKANYHRQLAEQAVAV